jgi:hypothetical protein
MANKSAAVEARIVSNYITIEMWSFSVSKFAKKDATVKRIFVERTRALDNQSESVRFHLRSDFRKYGKR